MPDTSPSADAACPHPMDPRRGDNLSPKFAAFLCWLLQLAPMTQPAITGISISGSCVLAATTDDPFFDTYLGSIGDLQRNLRDWGDACGADPTAIDSLLGKLRRAAA